jgi:hypothetical protein
MATAHEAVPVKLPASDFDHIRQWSRLEDEAIRQLLSPATTALLSRAVEALWDPARPPPSLDRDSLPATVRELRRLIADGSNGLSRAIMESSHHRDCGRIEEFRAVLQAFIDACPSRFYREIAEHYMTDYPTERRRMFW